MCKNSSQKLVLHKGRQCESEDLELSWYTWIMEQRKDEMVISTMGIIDKAVSLNPTFKGGDETKLLHCDYEFLKRRNLSVRTHTRMSLETSANRLPVKHEFRRRIMTTFNTRISDPKYLINIDETAIYLN